jgi:hypothetical protein
MTTLAYKQYCNIPFSSGSYASGPIMGPISHQAPGQMPYHSYGILAGIHPNPPQFGVADGASQFSNARRQYARTAWSMEASKTGTDMYSPLKPTSVFNAGTQKSYLLSQSTKYIAPSSSSLFTSTQKARAVGKSSYKQGLPSSAPLTYKNYNTNDVKSALQSVRGGGCVAPRKKGAISNTSLVNNGRGAGWGEIVRQTY